LRACATLIGFFNRSYYEDTPITIVHPEVLHNEGIPDTAPDDLMVRHVRARLAK